MRETLTGMLARHTGRPAEEIDADTERDLILDAEGAKAYGLVDHIVQNRDLSLPPHPAR